MTHTFPLSTVVGPCVIGLVTAAAAQDLQHRRIRNWLTFGAWMLALPLQCALHGFGAGALAWLGGWLTGLGLLLPFYLMRGMAAGDVKLMAAVGGWVGAPMALEIALVSFVAGGCWAIVQTLASGRFRALLRNLRLMWWSGGQVRPQHPDTPGSDSMRSVGTIPYGAAIAIGTLGVLFSSV